MKASCSLENDPGARFETEVKDIENEQLYFKN